MSSQSSEPLKVWQIAEMYPPGYVGGAGIYVQDVCRFLAARGHDVRVLCSEAIEAEPYSVRTDYDGPVRVDRINLPYLRGQDPGGWNMSIRDWRTHAARLERVADEILGDWTPDIVQFHTPYSVVEECLPAIERRGLPVVGMLHCAWLICPRLRLLRSPTSTPCSGPSMLGCLECLYSHWDGSRARSLAKLPWRVLKLGAYPAYRLLGRRRARKATHGLIGPSKFMAEVHEAHIDGPSEYIALGIDLTGLPAERPARPRTPLRFGFAGGFQEHKGIWQALDAVAALRAEGLGFEFHVWGPNQDAGRAEIARRGLDGCVIPRGVYEPSEKWGAYMDMDVLIMATLDKEPFGRVVQEAAAAGAPSIAPDIGGISEQIRDGVDGLLYRFRDVADLERQMRRVLERPALVGELAANLWEVVDTREAVERVEEFYRRIIRTTSDER